MVTKKTAAKKSSAKTSATPRERIVDAGLAEAAAVGWRHVSMDAVAARAGLPLGEVLLEIPSKTCLALAYLARIDERTLRPVTKISAEDSPRDRLFEILMRRFDALSADREGAHAIITGTARDPAAAAACLCRLQRSLAAILEAAGISSGGLIGLARVQGLGAVAAFALRAWMNDDSADMSKTMAALDRALSRAEKVASMGRFRQRGENAAS